MQQRRDEIAAKKARLAELKRQRELRQQEFGASRQGIGGSDEVPSRTATPTPGHKNDLDDLITSLVGKSQIDTGTKRSQSSTNDLSSHSEALSTTGHAQGHDLSTHTTQSKPHSWSISPLVIVQTEAQEPKREVETYSKGVQTSPANIEADSNESGSETDSARERPARRRLSRRDRASAVKSANSRDQDQGSTFALPQRDGPPNQAVRSNRPHVGHAPRIVPDAELEAIAQSEDFRNFLEVSSKIAERAINDRYDLLKDYRLHDLDEEDTEDEGSGEGQRRGVRIKEVAQLYDEVWSNKRTISDIGWSPKFPELLLASYTRNASTPHEADGLVQVWNMHMQSRPEYVFQATTEVLTAKFSPFHPNLIVGASYAGQVLLWDTRSRSPWAVQKSPLTDKAHTHPIYSLSIVGSQNAHNIITTSTDGTVCTWSFDMLSEPHSRLRLAAPRAGAAVDIYVRSDEIAPTCTAFPTADPSYFVAGSEEGTIHFCHAQNRVGAKAGIDPYVDYRGHLAPVMGVDFHRSNGPVDLGELVLSCGLDWSVKLWQVKPPAVGITDTTAGKTSIRPLLDLGRDDVVYDVKWSPVRAGVFAAVDGCGRLDVWNLNSSLESPAATASPSPGRVASMFRERSLNKCAWEQHNGQNIAVGGLDGVVTVFEVGSELGGSSSAKAEEWTDLRRAVNRLAASRGQ